MLKALFVGSLLLNGISGQELCQPGQQGCSAQEWGNHYAAGQYDPRLGESYAFVLHDRKAAQEEDEKQAADLEAASADLDSAKILAAQFEVDHFISDLQSCLFHGGARLTPIIRTYTKNYDINQPNRNGKTPLMAVCEIGIWPDFLEEVLEAGAKVSVKDNYGKTALDYARDYALENMPAYLWECSDIKEMLENALAQENGN